MNDRTDDPTTPIEEAPEGTADPGAGDARTSDGGARDAGSDGRAAEAGGGPEAEILRAELTRAQEELARVRGELEEARQRQLRARAELETFRRRVAGDLELAREAGLDAAVLPVLTVFDDLRRALQAAESSDDPAAIVPGVRAVLDSLERNLETLDIRAVGSAGEDFDPDLHEALTAVPVTGQARPGTIADVVQAGFRRGERLVRPARVLVYQDPE